MSRSGIGQASASMPARAGRSAPLSRLSWNDAPFAAVAIGVAAYCAWTFGSNQHPDTRSIISDLAFVPIGLLVVILAYRAVRASSADARSRRAWKFVTAALLFFWLGDTLWFVAQTILGETGTSGRVYGLSQFFYVAYYPPLLAGLLSFPRLMRSKAEARQFWLDVATVFVGGTMMLWTAVVARIVSPDGGSSFGDIVGRFGYPLGDLVLLFGTAVIASRRRADAVRPVFLLLTAGLLLILVNDAIFSVMSLTKSYRSGNTFDVVAIASWLFFGASAEMQRRVGATVMPESARDAPPTVSAAPYLAVVLGYGTLFFTALTQKETPLGVVLGAIVLTIAVLVRQYTAVSENVRLSAESAARASEVRFRSLVQNSSDMIAVISPDAVVRYQTPSVERLLGYTPEALDGTRLTDLLHPDDQARALALIADVAARTGTPAPVEWRLRRHGGDWFQAEVIVTNLREDPTIRGLVVTLRDIGERKALEGRLTHQAFHDPLTKLANRALLSDRVSHAQTRGRREDRPCAVLLLDLDDFKAINDTFGHGAGDDVLVEVADRLQGCIRAGDTAARLGGDEFAILLEDTAGATTAREVADRIAAALAPPVALAGKEAFLSASIGIAVGAPGENEGELLRNADVALYAAKARGKGGFEVFEPSMRAAVVERLELESDFRRALDERQLVLHYQPIVDLQTGRIVGAEALVRWRHPRRGLLAPGAFIPLAEDTGLIVPIGLWVIEEASRRLATLPGGGATTHVNVNLSARQLQEPDLVEEVGLALVRAGLPPERLVLEVTESLIMVDPRAMIPRLRALKDLGLRLAIDDFGTGYSSLAYLQNLPVDILKIDRSFLQESAGEAGLSRLARGIVDLGRAMQLITVAEGIERVEQVHALRETACEFGQGFYFARPMEDAAFVELIASGAVLPAPKPPA